MSLISDFIARLAADTSVTALVSTRIYDTRAPQAPAKPYIVCQEISATRAPDLSGSSGAVNTLMQVSCRGVSAISARSVGEQVRDLMDGYRGTMGSTDVRFCNLDGDQMVDDPPATGEAQGLASRIMEFSIWHSEAVPTLS